MQKINYLYHDSKQLELKERNLIITGKNGSGKTRFLTELKNQLINDQRKEKDNLEKQRIEIINFIKYGLDNFPLSLNINTTDMKKFNDLRYKDLDENQFKEKLIDVNLMLSKSLLSFNKNKRKYFTNTDEVLIKKHLESSDANSIKEDFYYFNNPEHILNFINKAKLMNENYIFFNKKVSFIPEYENRKDVYFFESSRVSSNLFTMTVFQSFESFKNDQQKHDVEDALEAFLIDQRMAFYDLIKFRESQEYNESPLSARVFDTNEIERWFLKIEKDLQTILENPTIELSFTKKGDQVLIIQKDKDISFSFDSLSSGFKAIFNIYANLLVRAQFQEVAPEYLKGIAIVDEIDVHLHISLQKKILPFLIQAFQKFNSL